MVYIKDARLLYPGGKTQGQISESKDYRDQAALKKCVVVSRDFNVTSWTVEDDARLCAGLRTGLTRAALAMELGRSYQATANRIRQLRYSGKLPQPTGIGGGTS